MKTQVYSKDVTVQWRDRVWSDKLLPMAEQREAYKNLKVGNMYVYQNEVLTPDYYTYKFITQTMEVVDGIWNVTYLN